MTENDVSFHPGPTPVAVCGVPIWEQRLDDRIFISFGQRSGEVSYVEIRSVPGPTLVSHCFPVVHFYQ